jgi:hypothetical protein
MGICLTVVDAPQGGMHAFFQNLRAYVVWAGIDVTDDIEGEDAALVGAATPFGPSASAGSPC